MNATEILENNHQLVLKTLEDWPESEWEVPGVCGEWSVKDLVAHFISYELALIDVIKTLHGEQPTPYVLKLRNSPADFNTAAQQSYRYQTAQQVLIAYQDVQLQSLSLLAQLPVEQIEQKGTLSWYKENVSLADLLQSLSAHVREHCAQIVRFKDNVQSEH